MDAKGRDSAVNWLRAHKGERVCLKSRDTTVKVIGTADGIQELDACGDVILQTEFRTGLPGVQITVTFHPETVAIHMIGHMTGHAIGRSAVALEFSLPVSLSYDQLTLSLAAEEGQAAPAPTRPSRLEREEVKNSPYALLFPRVD